MATQPNDISSAEKAYAAATETVAEPVKEAVKPVADKVAKVAKPAVTKAAAAPKPAKKAAARKVAATRPAKAAAKPVKVATKAAAKVAKPATTKPAVKKAAARTSATPSVAAKFKETAMNTTEKLTGEFKAAAEKLQADAKAGFAKGAALLGDAQEFAKGNVEAVVVSGKILGEGFKTFGESMVAETRTSIETLQADAKALAAVKSPNEFVQLQGEIMRRNVERAVSLTSKNAETMLKLANEAFAPIAGRVTLAVDKVRKAA